MRTADRGRQGHRSLIYSLTCFGVCSYATPLLPWVRFLDVESPSWRLVCLFNLCCREALPLVPPSSQSRHSCEPQYMGCSIDCEKKRLSSASSSLFFAVVWSLDILYPQQLQVYCTVLRSKSKKRGFEAVVLSKSLPHAADTRLQGLANAVENSKQTSRGIRSTRRQARMGDTYQSDPENESTTCLTFPDLLDLPDLCFVNRQHGTVRYRYGVILQQATKQRHTSVTVVAGQPVAVYQYDILNPIFFSSLCIIGLASEL
ncbi:hypothetical protein GGR54DRAFT_110024 [Hypoxylon sp. NC1633]|nr:hypothetical protein GGR54DRAFT_110024 [Hypoxylon sp. NC1633]